MQEIIRSIISNIFINNYPLRHNYAIVKLAEYFGVSTDYLLGVTEIKNHPNTELHTLHLSDDMIDLLMSGRINNRLLCEMALYPEFPRFMTDIEVCGDRIADMRVEAMRQLLDYHRKQVSQKYSPSENDLQMRTIELADVSEDLFFSHVLQKDLEKIVKDIRAAHVNDRTTSDAGSSPMEMTQQLHNDTYGYALVILPDSFILISHVFLLQISTYHGNPDVQYR